MTEILYPPAPLGKGVVWYFENWILEFVWDLGFGYWDFIVKLKIIPEIQS